MEKISAHKKDSVPRIVEKMLESGDTDITVSVPADSALNDSFSNFELLRREAEAAGKNIYIESRDERTMEMAERAGMTENARRRGGKLISDIVSVSHDAGGDDENHGHDGNFRNIKIDTEKTPKSFWVKAREESHAKMEFAKEIGEPPIPEHHHEKHEKKIRRRAAVRKFMIFSVSIMVLAFFSCWIAGAAFGRAEVTINFKKIPWEYKGTVIASKTFSQVDISRGYIPAEVFNQQKNTTRIFPASGEANISQKATATVTIYNSYSSSRQTLVATTRFSTPDGKIFRLDKSVVVPGAVIKDGKITPSSVDASVTADKAGTEYNVGPFDKLTIPGFKGTPRYDGFYASMPQAAAGGYVGNRKIATDQDIASARDKTSQGLREILQSGIMSSKPEGFDIIDGTSAVNITKLTVGKTADSNGNFSVLGEASLQSIGFKDDDLHSVIAAAMAKDNPDMDLYDLKITYGSVKADYTLGQMMFSITADAVLKPKFSEEELRSKIAGKTFVEAKSTVLAVPHLESAKISLWPFWLGGLPGNEARIRINWN